MAAVEAHIRSIGIIGGGKSGHAMLRFLMKTSSAKVAFIMDPDSNAPGLQEARSKNIPAFTKLEDALQPPLPEFIFEVSSTSEANEKIERAAKGTQTKVISQATSRMVVELVEDNKRQIQHGVAEAVKGLQAELLTSLKGSQDLVFNISQMMSSMQMLALNASIEAAKVGHAGKGFAVVADNMTKSVESVRKLTVEIDEVNKTLTDVSGGMVNVLELLK
jgi:methyl-accepting chemotaxis protein